MSSVPPKFFQVCRLCLMLIEEHDLSSHRIYSTTCVPTASNNECKCNIKLDNVKCCNKVRKCNNCDKYSDEQFLNEKHLPPRVPLSLNRLHTNVILKCDKEKINKQDFQNQFMSLNPLSSNSNEDLDAHHPWYDGSKSVCLDDSSTSVALQISKCLSLEVSKSVYNTLDFTYAVVENKSTCDLLMYIFSQQ